MSGHWSDAYRGLPYAEDGFTRAGLGCRGLVWLHYRDDLGIEIEAHHGAVSSMEREAAEALFRGAFDAGPWRSVERGHEREHDVAWFYEMRESGLSATHVGLVVRPGLMVHASRQSRVVAPEPYERGIWSKLLIGFQRHHEMDLRDAA